MGLFDSAGGAIRGRTAQLAARFDRGESLVDPRNLERRSRPSGKKGRGGIDQHQLLEREQEFGRWLRYHLYVPDSGPGEQLLISFASSRPDTPPRYAFPGVLSSQGCAVLFVRSLDGYWFGFDREPIVFEEAVELVNTTIAQRSVTPDNVIACGSSLGGQGALHVGSRCGLGAVLVGTPIVFLGSFLLDRPFRRERIRRVMAETMVGTDRSAREFLDGWCADVLLEEGPEMRITLYSSESDQLYPSQVGRLKELCDRSQRLSLELALDDYHLHSELHERAPDFFATALAKHLAPHRAGPGNSGQG